MKSLAFLILLFSVTFAAVYDHHVDGLKVKTLKEPEECKRKAQVGDQLQVQD
jgi:hypothetical protein